MSDTPPIESYETRVPPQNIDAEECVLGAVLLKNDAMDEIDFLVSTDFYQERHRKVFAAMVELSQDGQPIDLVTLQARLKDSDDLEAAGGLERLMYLAGRVPTAANVIYYARLVWEKSVYRQAIHLSARFAADAYESDTPVIKFLSEQADALAKLQLSAEGTKSGGVVSAKQASDNARDEYAKAIDNVAEDGTAGVGIDWGLKAMNLVAGKGKPGSIITLAGLSGAGKSKLIQQCALFVAEQTETHEALPVIYFSSEMNDTEMARRAACMLGGVSHTDVIECRLSREDAQRYNEALNRHSNLSILYVTRYFHSPRSLVSYATALVRRTKEERGLVVVDNLQDYAMQMFETDREQIFACGQIQTLLKGAFKNTGWTTVPVSQFTKGGKQSDAPSGSDLYGSSAVENAASQIVFIRRDKEDEDKFWLDNKKSRDLETSSGVPLYNERPYMRFADNSPSVRGFLDDQMSFRNGADGYMPEPDENEMGF